MDKHKKLEKGIRDIIDYIHETQAAQNATEPNAHGIQILLENLLKK